LSATGNFKNLTLVLVMISSMCVHICNRFQTKKANTVKITYFGGGTHQQSTFNMHRDRGRSLLTCAGPHSTANGVLGWAVSIKAGGVSFHWLQSRRWTRRQTDRQTYAFAKISFARF